MGVKIKIILTLFSLFFVLVGIGGVLLYEKVHKILPFVEQISKERVGSEVNKQPEKQRGASYVGSLKCKECHEEYYDSWKSSYHSKMIQSVKADFKAIVGDFSSLPPDADFSQEDIVYTKRK